MNILFLRPRAESGGATRHMLLLAAALAERGHRVTLGTSSGEWRDRFDQTVPLPLYPSLPQNLVASAIQVGRFVRRDSVDVIHSHHRFSTIVGKFASHLAGVPLVCTIHEFKSNWRWLSQLWIAPWVFVVSEANREFLIRSCGVSLERVTIVRLGAPPITSDLAVEDRISRVVGKVRGPVVGYVGRLSPEKGVAALLQSLPAVLQLYSSACAVVVGDGPERLMLETLAQTLGVANRVHFMGEQADASQLMTAMDIVVMPSLTENFSLTVAEAMAAGRPVVASNVGGMGEMVDDGLTGFLVPPNDPTALARRINDVLADPERAAAMGAAARRKAADWSPARAAPIVENLYQRAIDER